ncbi:sialic acid-binding Ig-like lectin 7 [Ctenopharyngodon idella]|uniref:sialic acid-binding Ig-like lectin 7 n=1 Tax=Ctenopharyngodon idella TaxID=7959 RepID=UPI002231B40D|nr:sialic acid-binding Ig-like lectin 7 [Ctenopharyngodon idella]
MLAADFLVFSSILSAAWCQSDINALYPKTLNATSGSCLLIPCQFTISKKKEVFLDRSPVVTWIRGSLWSLYDTDNFTNAHRQMEPQMKMVGDLQKKNCSSVMMNLTSLHSDRYFFKFQSEDYSVTKTKAVQINVSDSLAEPRVIVPVLREGEVGNLTCTVPAPCPSDTPNVTWDPALGGNITQWTQLNADGTQSVSANLNFIPSFRHHKLKVNCVSMHLLDRKGKPQHSHKTVILTVEYPPKETQISLTGSVWLGSNLTLTCQSNANPQANYSWFMKKEGIVKEVGSSRVLSFTVAHEKSGEYICEAQNLHGAVNSTILPINALGISFTAFLIILALFSVLIFALPILIYRRCKKPYISETKQDEDIYANVSSSTEKSHQLQSKTCGDKAIYTINPECTFRKNLSNEEIYANC